MKTNKKHGRPPETGGFGGGHLGEIFSIIIGHSPFSPCQGLISHYSHVVIVMGFFHGTISFPSW